MKRLIKWFATTSKTYYSVFVCEEHGTFKGKLKVKHNDNGLYYDVRIVKQTDEKGVDKIIDKQVKEREGTGKITINKRDLAQYFPSTILQYVVKQPLNKLEVAEKYDIKVNLCGGGFTGQSQALRLAIARALVKINPEDKKALRSEGFMTRDSRSVERKKPGRPKARRRFQFSKR